MKLSSSCCSSDSAAWNTPAVINDHICSELGHHKQNLVTNDLDCRRPLHFWLIAFLVDIRSKEEYCFESYVCVAADSPAALDQTITLLFQRAAHKRHFSDTRTLLYWFVVALWFKILHPVSRAVLTVISCWENFVTSQPLSLRSLTEFYQPLNGCCLLLSSP